MASWWILIQASALYQKSIRPNTKNGYDQAPHIFSMMKPLEGAIEAYKKLIEKFDVFILTSSPWDNETALNDKLNWLKNI